MSTYTYKMVDGIEVPLTPEEIEELEQRDIDWANRPPSSVPPSPS